MLNALKLFHSMGLNDGEIFYSRENSIVYEYYGNTFKLKNSGIDSGYGIRVIKGQKIGFSYTTSPEKIPEAVKSAISLSKFSLRSLFSFAPPQKYRNISGFDKKAEAMDEAQMKEIVLAVKYGIEKYSKVMRIMFVSQISENEIANTNLLFAHDKTSSFMVYAEAKNGNGSGCAEYSHYKMLEKPEEVGMRAGEMAKEMKNPKKLPAGKYTVIFSQEILGTILDLLANSFSGELKRRKISKLWDKEGQMVFDESLSMCNNPFVEAGAKSAFDSEGVSSRKTQLIKNGVIKDFYYDRECAALAGINKQGCCGRADYRTVPHIGNSNTVIAPGDSKPTEELRKYVYIESMHGLHTANPTTGDFGAEVSIGFLHENGKKIPVRGFMFSGNIFNLFNKIECMGKKQFQTADFICPEIAFKEVCLVS